MGFCQYVDLCFHASSLPCLHTFWHAIPTSFYISNVFLFSKIVDKYNVNHVSHSSFCTIDWSVVCTIRIILLTMHAHVIVSIGLHAVYSKQLRVLDTR